MKRVILAILSTVASLVLVLSFKTHSPTAAAVPPAAISTTGSSASSSGSSSTSGSGSSASGSSSSGSSSKKKSTSSAAKTYTGDAAMTRYGPVQVQITVKSGAVTSVNATDYPMNDPRDAQINSYAIPQLNSEALSAASASIDMVSGATYTSEGYLSSLQSALDKAGL
jgi:uncharacterized protein with FMN-binding domain